MTRALAGVLFSQIEVNDIGRIFGQQMYGHIVEEEQDLPVLDQADLVATGGHTDAQKTPALIGLEVSFLSGVGVQQLNRGAGDRLASIVGTLALHPGEVLRRYKNS